VASRKAGDVSGSTLKVDRLAREFWNSCAIAAGTHDAQAALECCQNAGEIEQAYELRLKTDRGATTTTTIQGSAQPSRSNMRRMEAKFAGRCAKCARGIAVGSPIAYDPDNKRAFHEGCTT
jgi:hypothetical protein